jgi:hypothetical protein
VTTHPKFLSLFRRSRYWHSRDDDSEDAARQNERYLVTCLAFCLEHDLHFRKQFWEEFCARDPKDKLPENLSIEVEGHSWCDLLLKGEGKVRVIECKINASLQSHQNPTKPEFYRKEKPSGYGHCVMTHFPNHDLLYVVLGPRALELPENAPSGTIQYRLKAWRHLVDFFPCSSITDDFFQSLDRLGVSDFSMKTLQPIRITGHQQVNDAAQILGILDSVLGNAGLGLSKRSYSPEWHFSQSNNPAAWIGMSFAAKGSHPEHFVQKLSSLANRQDGQLGWVGYEYSSENSELRRSLWLYCGDKPHADQIASILQKVPSEDQNSPELVRDNEDRHVGIKSPCGIGATDLDWFKSVFRRLGNRIA